MGDVRYERHLQHLRSHGPEAISELSDEEVVQALAALAASTDPKAPYLANVLASEAMNRLSRARATFTSTAEGLLTVDENGVLTTVNPAAERSLGWRESELRGLDEHAILHYQDHGGAPQERSLCPLRRVLETGAPDGCASDVFTRRDGTPLRVAWTAAPILRDGDITGAVVAFRPL